MTAAPVLLDAEQSAQALGRERFALTLIYALAVHLVLILGLRFHQQIPAPEPYFPDLEITLLPQPLVPEPEQPDQADFLAPRSQQGGAEETAPQPAPAVVPAQGPPLDPVTLPPEPAAPVPPPEPERAPEPELAAPAPSPEQVVQRPTPEPAPAQPELATRPSRPEQPQVQPRPSVHEMMTSGLQMARQGAIRFDSQPQASRGERRKHLSSSTREYKYAAYMEAWRAKVERIGNLNYPAEARRHNLWGSLRLQVEVRPDGSVRDIVLRRSSGHPVLDEAAVRIVKLAAPFAEFPDSFKDEVDVLVISRTWQFLPGNRLQSER